MHKDRVYDVTHCYNLGKKCFPPSYWGFSSIYNEVDRFTNECLSTTIGATGLPRLARSLLTLIGSWRIYYVFKIKARLPFNILFLKFQFALKKVLLSPIFFKTSLQTCKSNRALHLCWRLTKWKKSSVKSQFYRSCIPTD